MWMTFTFNMCKFEQFFFTKQKIYLDLFKEKT